jgi:RNA polymerase sigma factor (sigma-70 family)
MIEQYKELYKLQEGKVVVPLIEEWHWLDSMGQMEAKQELLEGLIQAVQRSPEESEGKLIFVLLTLEPIRRSICKKLLQGMPLGKSDPAPDRHRRHEARWIDHMERERFFDASRSATLELIYSYPMATKPGKLFGWFRETLAWKILHLYEDEYLSENRALTGYERARLSRFLTGLDELEPPDLKDPRGFNRWRQLLGDTRSAFAAVDEYRERPQVRKAFQAAIGRLSDRRKETILAYFYDGLSLEQIAERDGVTISTVGNTKSQAEERLRHDDLLYLALDSLGRFRSEARREEIATRYPDGRTEDGRRIFFIAS